METERLYYDNAYLTAFEGAVTEVREGWITLDRSAFYPTSGGQPFDTGVIRWAGEETRVTDVEAEDGVVWHRVEKAPPVGTKVSGEIDWARRLDHMQQHAGDHLLAGAAWERLGAVTIGLHVGREESSIDMTLPEGRTHLTREETEMLETLVNQRVQRDDTIRCFFPSAAEMEKIPLRKQPTVASRVRVVTMGDYEAVPCGGTHPASTGQVGPVKILSASPARGKVRLTFLAGMRAVRFFQRTALCAETVAAALSAPLDDAPEALEKERREQREKRRETENRLLTAALERLNAGRRGNVYAAHLSFADPGLLVRAAGELTKDPLAAVFLSCPGKNGCALVFARGKDAAGDMGALLRACGARGGGRPDMAQGTAPDGGAAETARTIYLER